MSTTEKFTRLTEEGLSLWVKHNIEADPRQTFEVQYVNKEHYWIKSWWGESALIPLDCVTEVVWNEELGEYV